MAILVTGGAGYIGSHCVKLLQEQEKAVVVADNLSTGHRAALDQDVAFYEGDIGDEDFLADLFQREPIEAVIHFAASSIVGESMKNPVKYFENNTASTLTLVKSMVKNGVKTLVFSSTAAVYGEPDQWPVVETAEKKPTNPYGQSKLMIEQMLTWMEEIHGLRWAALRYFNVAGAFGGIGEDHSPETHLVPILMEAALGKRDSFTVFGRDYDTPDGTCIRDYVHVYDLVNAHLLALGHLQAGGESGAFNLGSEKGYSVRQMVDAAIEVTGKSITVNYGARREGDPAALVASSRKAEGILGWKREYESAEAIMETAWQWHRSHPDGYKKITCGK